MLVDVITDKPVELLVGREAQDAGGVVSRPSGAQVICRNRAVNNAEGARRGAPVAI